MKKTFLLLTTMAVAFTSCKQEYETEEEKPYSVMEVKPQTTTLTITYPATIKGRQDIAVFPQIEGKIVKMCVEEGQRVKKGQTLVIIDQVSYQAALNTAVANLHAAKAKVRSAQLTWDSKKQLKEQMVISDYTVAKAESDLLTAKAELEQAQAEVTNASNSLSYTVVKSPSDGVIATLPYRIGALVSPSMSEPLTYVSDNDEMIAYFSLNENQLSSLLHQYGSKEEALKQMPEVQLQLNDGSLYDKAGKIATISGVLDPQTGTASVRAAFDNANGLLMSGASGHVIMPLMMENALVIPKSAVTELQDKLVVYKIVNGESIMTSINVYPIDDGKHYIVSNGLNIGDYIKAN